MVMSIKHARRVFARFVLSMAAAAVLLPPTLQPAQALDIRLTSGNWQPINLFVERFGNETQLAGNFPSEIISQDLTRSGEFKVQQLAATNWTGVNEEYLNEIGQKGGEYLLSGNIATDNIKQEYTLQFSLYDIITQQTVGTFQTRFTTDSQRLAAHNVANWILEEITGQAGIFHTKVAYVVRGADDSSALRIADYDGYNRQTILRSQDRIISPSWSPDGNELVYVSFEQYKPIIYRQSLLTGERAIIANFKGSNSAPAISPDLQQVAAALTEHGGEQQIYLISDASKQRLRASNGIDTEPTFSPDGRFLAFSSDEAGSLQIYQFDLSTRDTKRLTFSGKYNASPQYSSDGKNIVFISRSRRGENVNLLEIASGAQTELTDIRQADSPTFAPNDNIILYKDKKRPNYLATISINGKVMVFWDTPEDGSIIDPAWGPAQSGWF